MKIKTAVILCGGRGTRLGNLGKKLPKALVKIHQRPIIWYILKILIQNSFNHFILPLGYKGSYLKNYIKNFSQFRKYKIDLINTGIETSIARRVYKIKKNIISNNFLLLNGDAIFKFNVKKIFDNHEQKKLDITFLGCETPLNYGIIGKKNNRIISFERDIKFNTVKSKYRKNFTGHVYSGISVIKKNLLKDKIKYFKEFEKEFYPKIIKRNKTHFEAIDGFWYSIDNQKDIRSLHFKKNINYNKIKKIKNNL